MYVYILLSNSKHIFSFILEFIYNIKTLMYEMYMVPIRISLCFIKIK